MLESPARLQVRHKPLSGHESATNRRPLSRPGCCPPARVAHKSCCILHSCEALGRRGWALPSSTADEACGMEDVALIAAAGAAMMGVFKYSASSSTALGYPICV